jgi:hypothetical protein
LLRSKFDYFYFFFRATQSAAKKNFEETVPPPIKMQDVKAARQLASDITQSGAKLYDLLENEHIDRQERAKALRFLDLAASTSGSCPSCPVCYI